MKRIISVLTIFTAILFFSNCKKDTASNAYTITAYTQTDSATVFLYVNDQNKGELPLITMGADDCNDNRALNLALDPGIYNLTVRTEQGDIKNTLVLDVSEDGGINAGSNYTFIQFDKCILLGMDY